MDLTSDDVQDILNLLDGLPFGEMHLQTARFSLWLRRTPDGGWTQEMQVRSEPTMTPAAAGAGGAAVAGEVAGMDAGTGTGVAEEVGEANGAGEAAGVPAGAGAAAGDAAGVPAGAGAAAGDAAGAPEEAAGAPAGAPPDGMRAVCAALPGTFYRAPMPGAPPFVDTGSHVDPETVVAIIETMKLMNSVCAGVSGTVAEILLADAQPAGKDAALMWIREDR